MFYMNDGKLVHTRAQTCEFQNSFNLGTSPLNVDPLLSHIHVEQVGLNHSKASGLHCTMSSPRITKPPDVWMLCSALSPWIRVVILYNYSIIPETHLKTNMSMYPKTSRLFWLCFFSTSNMIQPFEEPIFMAWCSTTKFCLTFNSFSTFLVLLLPIRWNLKHAPNSFDPPMSVISF